MSLIKRFWNKLEPTYTLKAGWIPKLLSTKNNILSITLEHNLSKIGLDLQTVLKMNFKSTKSFEIIKCIPQFYQDIYLFIWGFTSLSTLYRLYHDG